MKRLAVMILLAACGSSARSVVDQPTAAPEPPKDAIVKTLENGPVKVIERVWPSKPTLDDPIYVRIEISAPAGVSISAPLESVGDGLGRFEIKDHARASERGPEGGHVETQTYRLAAPSSGKHRLPPLRLEMIDARGTGSANGRPQELLTDEVALDVAPVKAEAVTAELKPAASTLDPDVGGPPWSWILGGVSLAAVLASGTILLVRARRARVRRARQQSAYDDAVARLQALEARGAPSTDDADAWFVELSAIGRTYIERRFEIRAPELTTEEFLQVLAQNPGALGERHRGYLGAFLATCDRVKFAGARPSAEESIRALAETRAFVDDTRVRDEVAPARTSASRAGRAGVRDEVAPARTSASRAGRAGVREEPRP